jgi:magnesium transporter
VAGNFLEGLLSRLGSDNSLSSSDGDGPSFSAPPAPFELEVVEAALLEVTGQLDTLLLDASARVAALLRVLPQRLAVTADILEELRLVKQSLVELDSRAGAIRSLLLEVLDDEEDVRGMMLSRISNATEEVLEDAEDEVENLLEYYLQRCETCHGEAERLLENTRDLEESISVSLSARRFEVNKLELMLSIATFATAVGALVAGIFGMNLRNRFEMSTGAFYGTSVGIVAGVVVLCALIYKYTRRKRIL